MKTQLLFLLACFVLSSQCVGRHRPSSDIVESTVTDGKNTRIVVAGGSEHGGARTFGTVRRGGRLEETHSWSENPRYLEGRYEDLSRRSRLEKVNHAQCYYFSSSKYFFFFFFRPFFSTLFLGGT